MRMDVANHERDPEGTVLNCINRGEALRFK